MEAGSPRRRSTTRPEVGGGSDGSRPSGPIPTSVVRVLRGRGGSAAAGAVGSGSVVASRAAAGALVDTSTILAFSAHRLGDCVVCGRAGATDRGAVARWVNAVREQD